MYLNVIPSDHCSTHQIRMPGRLRKDLNLDLGDRLIFNTPMGDYSLQINKATLEDILEHGEKNAFVSVYSPILDAKSSDVLVEPHEITIGCDPELFLLDRRDFRVVPADRLMPKERKFGSDGELAELRPDYALSPEQLVLNLKRLIVSIPFNIPNWVTTYASSWYAYRCSGFHIHLGMPIELLSFAADKTDIFLKHLVTALDYFVGIPAASLDPDDKRRLSNNYGRPGDYRISMRTLEYRTPGGFHLKSPKYTKSLLNSAFYITDKIIKDAEEASENWANTEKIVDFKYFMNRYNLPPKKYIKSVLASKDRKELKYECNKINPTLNAILGDNSKFSVKERSRNEQHFFREWLGDAT